MLPYDRDTLVILKMAHLWQIGAHSQYFKVNVSFKSFIFLTLKCLSIGTPKTINFPFVSNEKLMFLGVPVFKHIVMRL